MVDDRPEDKGALGESGRPRREPPTIELKATEVSETPKETKEAATAEAGLQAEDVASQVEPEPASAATDEPVSKPVSQPVSPWAIAPISGAVAATLVIAVGWALGWPTVQAPAPAPQLNAAAIDDLTARIAGLETKTSKPAAPVADPAAAARMDAIEKSLADAARRTRRHARAGGQACIRHQRREGRAARWRCAAGRSFRHQCAHRRHRARDRAAGRASSPRSRRRKQNLPTSNPADDVPLRRLVASSLLDVLVRVGDPYVAALAATKSLSPNADALKPLEAFAASGVPNANALCRELLTIVPKLNPPAADSTATTGTGIVDRLQAGASKLVRVQRADATGDDRGSVVARVTAAACATIWRKRAAS